MNMLFFLINVVMWTAGTMCLLAGVVGVSNIMLITVKERTKEFGVRKALGAPPGVIIAMLFKESIALTAIAGLCGLATGTALLALVGAILDKVPDFPLGPPVVSLTNALVAVGVLIAAGGLAGIMPASHAASIRPVEALRAE